jgi:hypothetical protein
LIIGGADYFFKRVFTYYFLMPLTVHPSYLPGLVGRVVELKTQELQKSASP